MTFQECLNSYIEELQCSGKELAGNSGVSETIISRYRKGDRVPTADSEYLKKLSAGIARTALKKGKPEIKAEEVYQKSAQEKGLLQILSCLQKMCAAILCETVLAKKNGKKLRL